jgi:hypothetical protein
MAITDMEAIGTYVWEIWFSFGLRRVSIGW